MPRVPAGLYSDLENLAQAIRAECRHDGGDPAKDAAGRPVGCDPCDDKAHTIEQAAEVIYDLTRQGT